MAVLPQAGDLGFSESRSDVILAGVSVLGPLALGVLAILIQSGQATCRGPVCIQNFFVFLSNNRNSLEKVKKDIQKFLKQKLKLTLHPNKVFLQTTASGIDFLGWKHFDDHRILRKTTQKRMLKRLQISPTNETLQSYLGLLKHGDGLKLRDKLLNEYWLNSSTRLDARSESCITLEILKSG